MSCASPLPVLRTRLRTQSAWTTRSRPCLPRPWPALPGGRSPPRLLRRAGSARCAPTKPHWCGATIVCERPATRKSPSEQLPPPPRRHGSEVALRLASQHTFTGASSHPGGAADDRSRLLGRKRSNEADEGATNKSKGRQATPPRGLCLERFATLRGPHGDLESPPKGVPGQTQKRNSSRAEHRPCRQKLAAASASGA